MMAERPSVLRKVFSVFINSVQRTGPKAHNVLSWHAKLLLMPSLALECQYSTIRWAVQAMAETPPSGKMCTVFKTEPYEKYPSPLILTCIINTEDARGRVMKDTENSAEFAIASFIPYVGYDAPRSGLEFPAM